MTCKPPLSIERLMNSALAVDSMMGPVFKWARLLNSKRPGPAAAFVSTSAKSKEQIVADMARALRWAGLLKPGKPPLTPT
jgi:hypothetical protein